MDRPVVFALPRYRGNNHAPFLGVASLCAYMKTNGIPCRVFDEDLAVSTLNQFENDSEEALDHLIRHIVSVKPVKSVPVRCIQVDSPSKLYLAGHSFVPTHNTVLCQTAVVWAALSGATPFVCLIAASADRVQNLLENIKTWLECNVSLQEDFPEVCFPVKCLERISNRQKGQKYLGQPTRIEWSADKVVLPTIEGSKASGVVITCSGMHGSDIRGQQHARPDGKVERPGLVLIDDPQTTESAWSRSQSQRRDRQRP